MNVYGFDSTIYDGEAIIDFLLFCVKKDISLTKYIPVATRTVMLYKSNLLPIDKLYELIDQMSSKIIKNREQASSLVKEFWLHHKHKLNKYFLDKITCDDVIITAAPRVLISGIFNELKTNNIICSEFNLETGKFDFLCFGENKLIAFKEQYPNATIDEFYTVSMSDSSIIEISNKAFLVKKKNPPKRIK